MLLTWACFAVVLAVHAQLLKNTALVYKATIIADSPEVLEDLI